MTEGNFVDYVKLIVTSGSGGKGSIHLHREKFVTKGGPDGGDGGRGGHVIIKANKQLWTLYNFKFKKNFSAGHGGDGRKNRSSGNQGEDIFIEVPLGTVIRDTQSNDVLFEITEEDQEEILLKVVLEVVGIGILSLLHVRHHVTHNQALKESAVK